MAEHFICFSARYYKVSVMLSALYNDKVIALAANIPHSGLLENAPYQAKAHSKICGSTITVSLQMTGDIVSHFGQEVKACLLGQCAASILGAHIIGCDKIELLSLQTTMEKMLKEGGDPPTGKWEDLALLLPVREVKQRHSSVMLVFDAVTKAVNA